MGIAPKGEPLGLDCDGLGEQGYQLEYTNSRRKSWDIAPDRDDNLASSPLKECFDFRDAMRVWAEAKYVECEGDVHVANDSKSRRSVFLMGSVDVDVNGDRIGMRLNEGGVRISCKHQLE